MDYGEVLTKAWKIIWKYKILWIFGILAGCGRAASGGSGGGRNNFNYQFNQSNPPQFSEPFRQFQNAVSQVPVWVWILLAVLILGLILVTVVLNTIGKIGLIHGANLADADAGGLAFGALFSSSLRYFWRIFLLAVLLFLASLVIALIIAGAVIVLGVATLGIGLLCLLPLLCLLIPIGWFVNVLIEQSYIAIVTEDLGIFPGLQRGWEVVTKNIGPFIIMALILFIGGAIVSFIVALPIILILLPGIVGAVGLANGSKVFGAGILVSILFFLIYLPILLAANGIIQSYITSAWTLTYRRLTGRGPAALGIPLAPAAPEPFGP